MPKKRNWALSPALAVITPEFICNKFVEKPSIEAKYKAFSKIFSSLFSINLNLSFAKTF
ncbi:hypothetical protein [Campylobacter sp. LR196d]|uniref:hypothetical protein n=1 Tax=Campylobacter sp. LR196d TaxID=2593543 RepID=UPI001CC1D6FE|nr:hypothetical protein [Campylobacter sp. LR196d]